MQELDNTLFLTSKIRHLETAFLHVYGNSLLKLPSRVIQTIEVDDNGFVWFAIAKPSQQLNQFDEQFFVDLNYSRKGLPFYLKTHGLARLVSDPKELTQLSPALQNETINNKVLVSVKILNATYYENEKETSSTWYHKCRNFIRSIFNNDDAYILTLENGPYLL